LNCELLQLLRYSITDVKYFSVAVLFSVQYRSGSDNGAAIQPHVHTPFLQAHSHYFELTEKLSHLEAQLRQKREKDKVMVKLYLCLIKYQTMNTHGGAELYFHTIISIIMLGGELSASRLGPFTHGDGAPGTHCIGG
jgi:hypothetical protein